MIRQSLLLFFFFATGIAFDLVESKEKTTHQLRMKRRVPNMEVKSVEDAPSSTIKRRNQIEQCRDHTDGMGKEWVAVSGTWYNCAYFAIGNRCDSWFTSIFRNYGHTAKSACCVCGGGIISSERSNPLFTSSVKETSVNTQDMYVQEWLREHNRRREKYHGIYGKSYVPLTWNDTLAKSSKAYAEQLIDLAVKDGDGENCQLLHKIDGFRGGENLAWKWGGEPDDTANVLYRWTEKVLRRQ